MNDVSITLNKYGLELLSTKKLHEAAEFFWEAIERDPRYPDAHTNLGVTLFLQGKLDEALAAYENALALRPRHGETLLNASYALWDTGQIDTARSFLEMAVEEHGLAAAHFALGKLLRETGEEALALRHLREGLRLEPNDVAAHGALRELLHHYGDEEAALHECDEMIRLQPHFPLHPYKKACVMLAYGLPDGWKQYESRYYVSLDTLTTAARNDPKLFGDLVAKKWDGSPTGHLLVHREQGFGDCIQFLRFIPFAAARCEKLTLFLPPTLRRMAKATLRDCPNVDLVEDLQCPMEFDTWCLLLSLPYLLDMTTGFPTEPYITAPKQQYGEVRELSGLKIGLAWKGNAEHEDDRWRSIPFETMARLFDVPANYVSLHFPSEVDKSRYPLIDVYPTPSSYFGHLMIDWSETAALIDALDLVIAADTAVVHMAGAMGKPVWMINRYNSDWRWGLRSSDTIWYPSMRIFRQRRLGDWDTVMDEVVMALRDWR